MIILVLNSGSSSIKFRLFKMPEEQLLLKGLVEGIGSHSGGAFLWERADRCSRKEMTIHSHQEALQVIFEELHNTPEQPEIIAHRVVHGGEKYKVPVVVTPEVVQDIEALFDLAPLHNPPNLAGIRICQEKMPTLPNIAIFDTAFHQTLPPKAYLYGLPYELYEKYRIRKYGFHGISHKYVSRESMRILKENIKDFKILSCHLGAGASICAIEEGKSVQTSMGFTPLDGLMMGTRAGSFDPEIIVYLMRKGHSITEIEEMMQKKSGLKGISRRSFDVRDLREDELSGGAQSELAFEMFVSSVQRYLGSYSAVLGGLDLIIFTGGVGEKAYYLRRRILESFSFLGVKMDVRKNRANETIISAADSNVTVMVIPANEELQMAREAYQLIQLHPVNA